MISRVSEPTSRKVKPAIAAGLGDLHPSQLSTSGPTPAVEVLEQIVSSQFDLFVIPFGCSISTGDQAHSMDSTKVPVAERVPALGLIVGAVGQPEVPRRIRVPIVASQKVVLVIGRRLAWTPLAPDHVLAGVDEITSLGNCSRVDAISSQTHTSACATMKNRLNGRTVVPSSRMGYAAR